MNSGRTAMSAHKRLPAIEEQAAAWLARRYGGFRPEEKAAFDAWLAEDPRNADAVKELEKAWRLVALGAAGQGDIARARERSRTRLCAGRRQRALAAAAAIGVALLTGWFAWNPGAAPPVEMLPQAGIALRPDLRELPDGSSVQLNARAEIAIEFSPERRLVRLIRGQALFTVARDGTRPFVAAAGAVEVRALGTAFAVRFDPGAVDVLVTEGTVAVERPAAVPAPAQPAAAVAASPGSLRLTAGQRTQVPLAPEAKAPVVAAVTPAEIATVLAWRERRIEFTRTPLAEAVRLFNSQNRTRLVVADPVTGRFEISGIFWADDPESFVRLLVSAFDMRSELLGDEVTLRKR
jgi:transmembrane sensor